MNQFNDNQESKGSFYTGILIISLLYTAGILISSLIITRNSIPFFLWVSTGLVASVLIVKQKKYITGVFIGILIWTVALYISKNQISFIDYNQYLLQALGELLTLLIFYSILKRYLEPLGIVEQQNGLLRLTFASLIAPVPQSLVITIIIIKNLSVQNHEFIDILFLTWFSISIPLFVLSPLSITLLREKNKFTALKISNPLSYITWLIILIPLLLCFGHPISGNNLYKILLILYITVVLLSIMQNSKILFLNNPLFITSSLVLILSSIDQPASEFDGGITFYLLFILVGSIGFYLVNSIISERNTSIESLKKGYLSIEEAINHQTQYYRDLNVKLLEEIDLRAQMQRELNLSKKLLTDSHEIASMASWEIYPKTQRIRWSENAYKLFGVNSNSDLSTIDTYIKIIHPDSRDQFQNKLKSLLSAPISFEMESRHLGKDGSIRYLLLRGRSFEENGQITRIVGLTFDITERKKVELELAENELKYRALFESNNEAVSVIDAETKTFIDINKAFELMYGYTKEELIGKPYVLISAEKSESTIAIDEANRKKSYRILLRKHIKKDGTEFFIESSFVKFSISDKPMLFILSHDITLRKMAEKNLEERELQYRLFFESNLIGMAEMTIQKEWINFNNKLCEILGYTREELKEFTWDLISHSDDLKDELNLFNNLISHQIEDYNIEKRFIRKDKKEVYCNVLVKAIRNPLGNISHMVILVEDITSRKRAELDLIESRQKLRRAQQIANLGTILINIKTNSIALSNEALNLLGWKYREQQAELDDLLSLILPGSRSIADDAIQLARQGIVNENGYEIPVRLKDDLIRYFQLNIGYNKNRKGVITEIVLTIADITDIKMAEITLTEANTMKDQLFSVIAHDLRGPVGSIKQISSLLFENYDSLDSKTRQEILESIRNTSEQTYNLLENLLEWAKSQRQTSINLQKLNIKQVTEDTIALLSGMSSPKGILIELSIDDSHLVLVDEQMLKTIMRNLLSNAIKFTPLSGKIKIETSWINDQIEIRISDTGKGMSDEVVKNIFSNNYHHSTLGTNDERGSGLGLKLVKRFVDKMGGLITIRSEPEKGTTFIVTLPKA